MTILAFDTAGPALSVAVVHAGRVLSALHRPLVRGHAEMLMPAVAGVLCAAKLRLEDCDAVATTVGPGSFTGLRTGLAAAQGLSLGADIPLVGISRFEAYAEATGSFRQTAIVVAMDSKARSLYIQTFAPDGTIADGWPSEGLNGTADSFADTIWPKQALAIGDGVLSLLAEQVALVDTGRRQLPASAVAACAERALADGHTGLPAQPLYLAPPRAIAPKDGGRLRAR